MLVADRAAMFHIPRGDTDTSGFVWDRCRDMPDLAAGFASGRYNALLADSGLPAANAYLRDFMPSSMMDDDPYLVDDVARCSETDDVGRVMSEVLHAYRSLGLDSAVSCLGSYRLPAPRGKTPESKHRQLNSRRWYEGRIARRDMSDFEAARRASGKVGYGLSPFASPDGLGFVTARDRDSRSWMMDQVIVSTDGQQLELSEVSSKSVSNPRNLFAETVIKFIALEGYAKSAGKLILFITQTVPSYYHAGIKIPLPNGDYIYKPNNKFDGSSPIEAKNWHTKINKRINQHFRRAGVKLITAKVTEFHHDGTPHFHSVLVCDSADYDFVTKTYRNYSIYGVFNPSEKNQNKWEKGWNEKGALEHRFDHKVINPRDSNGKGGLTAYLMPYLSKNIDGNHNAKDYESGLDYADSVRRHTAAKKLYRMRQFSFSGFPPVSIWRLLRNCKEGDIINDHLDLVRKCADDADYLGYVDALGGFGISAKDRPFAVWREESDDLGRYGDPIDRIVGVKTQDNQFFKLKKNDWKIISVKKVEAALVDNLDIRLSIEGNYQKLGSEYAREIKTLVSKAREKKKILSFYMQAFGRSPFDKIEFDKPLICDSWSAGAGDFGADAPKPPPWNIVNNFTFL